MSKAVKGMLLGSKLIGLTLILIALNGLGAQLLGWFWTPEPGATSEPAPEPSGSFFLILLAVMLLQTVALAYPILASRWHGWRLAATIAIAFFGTVTFLSQIESLVYLDDKMPQGMLPGLFVMGLAVAVPFAPIAVTVLGRWRAPGAEGGESAPDPLPSVGRWLVAGFVMFALYYLFGYYVAWKDPGLRAYYGGSDPGSFFAQITSVARDTPWMLPFQYLRGLVWTALAVLVIRSMRPPWWHSMIALGLLFAVPSLYLLFPNPVMPDAIRMTHLVETAPYQLLFGCFAGWWLTRRDSARPALEPAPQG